MNTNMNLTVYDIGLLNGLDTNVLVVDTEDRLSVGFFCAGEHVELPDGYNGKLESVTIKTLDLCLPKTVYGYNDEPFDPLNYIHGLHIEANNGGSRRLRDVAEKLYIWSEWGKRGLIPDPVLENAESYGTLVEHLAKLNHMLCKEQ